MLEHLRRRQFASCPGSETVDKRQGRSERRRYGVQDLSDAGLDGYAHLHGRRQALRIERDREVLKTGKRATEVTYALTSLAPRQAAPKQLAALVRHHCHIENRLHSVRDFTCDEDRCRASVRNRPGSLATRTNTAVSIIRTQTPFACVPQANRHFAARPQEALDRILQPPVV